MRPGGLTDDFMTAFGDATGVTAIVAAHEGGAGYMADGFARASGRFGACMAIATGWTSRRRWTVRVPSRPEHC